MRVRLHPYTQAQVHYISTSNILINDALITNNENYIGLHIRDHAFILNLTILHS